MAENGYYGVHEEFVERFGVWETPSTRSLPARSRWR